MTQRPRIALLFLSLMATSAFGAIQPSDFIAEEDGSVVYIDGAQGAKLHLEYTGAHLTAPLKVKITPDDPGLRLSGATCTVQKPGDICTSTLHLTNTRNKIYGVHQFTVTEVGAPKPPAPTGTSADAKPVSFGVGLREKGAPIPVEWYHTVPFGNFNFTSPIILANATQSDRLYSGSGIEANPRPGEKNHEFLNLYNINLPAGKICYLDKNSVNTDFRDRRIYWQLDISLSFKDITDPNHPIFNAPAYSGNSNITTCSAAGGSIFRDCASGLWGSMSVGLANIGSTTRVATSWSAKPSDNINAGEVKVISDNGWKNASWSNPGSIFYFQNDWEGTTLALLQIQGSTDGSGFDVKKAAPTALQIQAAPPCSNFIQK